MKRLLILLLAFSLAVLVAACGDDSEDTAATPTQSSSDAGGGGKIQRNDANAKVHLTIGSKNFTEQKVLGEIYAQGLEAAGYAINKDLNLGDEKTALAALKSDEISAYPEYTGTALLSFFGKKANELPKDPQAAYEEVKKDFAADGLTAFPPTPFTSSNEVAVTKATAEKLGLKNISDLSGKSQDLTLYGSPECRQRIDCMVGLQKYYNLDFKSFTPVDIGLRYDVLDKGQADLSIIFTTDAQLFTSNDYVTLEDDKHVLPAGNVIFIASKDAVDQAGPDFGATIEQVQQHLTLPVMQELNARVTLDKEEPSQAAEEYLKQFGYIN